jgi:hypothetical protein
MTPVYRQGYDAAMQGVGWNRNPYEPGSKEFLEFMAGHSEGTKARALLMAGVGVMP